MFAMERELSGVLDTLEGLRVPRRYETVVVSAIGALTRAGELARDGKSEEAAVSAFGCLYPLKRVRTDQGNAVVGAEVISVIQKFGEVQRKIEVEKCARAEWARLHLEEKAAKRAAEEKQLAEWALAHKREKIEKAWKEREKKLEEEGIECSLTVVGECPAPGYFYAVDGDSGPVIRQEGGVSTYAVTVKKRAAEKAEEIAA